MRYDEDLLVVRRAVWLILIGNLLGTLYQAYRHEWPLAVAGGIWTLVCAAWLRVTHAQQTTRDVDRVVEAGHCGRFNDATARHTAGLRDLTVHALLIVKRELGTWRVTPFPVSREPRVRDGAGKR